MVVVSRSGWDGVSIAMNLGRGGVALGLSLISLAVLPKDTGTVQKSTPEQFVKSSGF